MCRNSLGPCALECGPSTPVMRNCASRELLAQHAHERDRAAFAHVGRRACRTPPARRCVDRLLEPGASGGAFQPRCPSFAVEARPSRRRADRPPAACLIACAAALASSVGGSAQAELGGRVAAAARCRRRRRGIAVHAGDRELRPPGAVEHQLGRGRRPSAASRRRTGTWRRPRRRARAPRALACSMRCGGICDVELGQLDLAGGLVLEARRAAGAGCGSDEGTMPRGVARVHALGQHPHRERAAGEAAQRRGEPQLVVVAAARIEADDQRRLADAAQRGDRRRPAGRSCRIPRRPRSGRRSARAARFCSLQRLERGRAQAKIA